MSVLCNISKYWMRLTPLSVAFSLLFSLFFHSQFAGFDDHRHQTTTAATLYVGDDPKADETSFLQLPLSRHPDLDRAYLTEPVLDGGVDGMAPKSDWLFNYVSSSSCSEPNWDNTDKSIASRVFLPFFFIGMVGLVLVKSGRIGSFGGWSDTDTRETGSIEETSTARRCDLDYARIVCVAAVVVNNSGGSHWIRRNSVFVISWFLPFLYVTSGISFMLSKRTTMDFLARLGMILVIGVGANLIVDVIDARNWQGDFGNTVFQMSYVLMLIVMALVAGPLRYSLLWRAKHPGVRAPTELWLCVLVFGTITVVSMAFFGMGRSFFPVSNSESADGSRILNSDDALAPLFDHAPIVVIQVSGCMFLSHLGCLFDATDVLPWLLLAHIFIPRVLIPWPQVGFPHNLELFIFAMVAEAWKIQGTRAIAKFVHNYWPALIFFLCLATVPDYYGRCDLLPPNTYWERLRFYSMEFVLCFCLSAGAFAVADPWEATEWLTYWALYAYCFHVAWARLLPQPYGAVLTFASAIVFYAVYRMRPEKVPATEKVLATSSERKADADIAGG